ncbi:MAG: hypothetical protein ACXWK9_10075 [Myxococcaceae bacterium]
MTTRWSTLVLFSLLLGCGSTAVPTTGSCSTTVADYCASHAPGICTWPGPAPSPAECAHTLRSTSCSAYDAVLLQGVDTGTYHYYERASGALAAVIDYSAVFGKRTCEAGPGQGFAEPACDASSFVSSCSDAGS